MAYSFCLFSSINYGGVDFNPHLLPKKGNTFKLQGGFVRVFSNVGQVHGDIVWVSTKLWIHACEALIN